MKEVLGIDFGNTIVHNVKGDKISAGQTGLTEVRDFENAFNCIIRLIDERFGAENVHLISKVSPTGEARVREWLRSHDFAITGFNMDNMHFCRERHEKGPICKKLGITHMIDDRPEVMMSCSGIVPFKLLFRPSPQELETFKVQLSNMTGVTIMNDWWDVERYFFGSLKKWENPTLEELVGGSRVEIRIDGKVCLGVSMKKKIVLHNNAELLALIDELKAAATHE